MVPGAAIAYGFRPTALVVIAIMTRDWAPLLDAVLLSGQRHRFVAVMLAQARWKVHARNVTWVKAAAEDLDTVAEKRRTLADKTLTAARRVQH